MGSDAWDAWDRWQGEEPDEEERARREAQKEQLGKLPPFGSLTPPPAWPFRGPVKGPFANLSNANLPPARPGETAKVYVAWTPEKLRALATTDALERPEPEGEPTRWVRFAAALLARAYPVRFISFCLPRAHAAYVTGAFRSCGHKVRETAASEASPQMRRLTIWREGEVAK